MFGLMDCNNFYASCERVFNPSLNGRPVVVLSNNDGCVIARSNEAKALDIPMGAPAYQIKELVEKHGVAVFSSNYTLYGDMSARVMSILSSLVPDIEVYSIDEAFVNLDGVKDYQSLPTRTLAKMANKFAKKYPAYKRVCCIDTEEKREKALCLFAIGDVWGIGRRQAAKLEKEGVKTAYDFTQLPGSWVRKYMTVVGERTWKELRGIPCITENITPRKQICTSRSFGQMIDSIELMDEAVSTFASTCAKKLREQKGYAVSLHVFIITNRFREDLPQYWKSISVNLPVPTDDTLEIVHYALCGLRRIFKTGYQYKKAGVIITEITHNVQNNLFDTVDRDKRERLMNAIDSINGKHGHSVKLAVQGQGTGWKLKQEQLSKHYTTDLGEIIEIHCKK